MNAKTSLWAIMVAALVFGVTTASNAGENAVTNTNGSIYRDTQLSVHHFNSSALPVLVRVSKQGKITSVAAAYSLRYKYRFLLRRTLAAMITAPAHNKQGQPIASEFIMYVTGKTTKRNDGKYDFRFAYVGTRPVPFGNWYWAQFADGRLALRSRSFIRASRQVNRIHYGTCYYNGVKYGNCSVYLCVYAGTCECHEKSCADNGKDNNAPQETADRIRPASTHIYRLHKVTARSPRVSVRTASRGPVRISAAASRTPYRAAAARQPMSDAMQARAVRFQHVRIAHTPASASADRARRQH